MKSFFASLFFIFCFALYSCKKNDNSTENPLCTGPWKVSHLQRTVFTDDNFYGKYEHLKSIDDFNDDFLIDTLEFHKNHTVYFKNPSKIGLPISGTWAIDGDSQSLKIDLKQIIPTSPSSERIWYFYETSTIIELTPSSLVLESIEFTSFTIGNGFPTFNKEVYRTYFIHWYGADPKLFDLIPLQMLRPIHPVTNPP